MAQVNVLNIIFKWQRKEKYEIVLLSFLPL